MIKLFVTGDNHIGKKYDRYPEIKEMLIQSRFDSMRDMVSAAHKEGCGLFVITGDLFDNINNIKVGDVKQVVDILSEFEGTVLILPGNHDYYTGEEKVWKDFEKVLLEKEHNIVLLNEFRQYDFEVGDEKVVVYPAYCQSKHSSENNLSWIKELNINNEDGYNVGVAHGAIKGLTPDMKEEYFMMTIDELLSISVDVWFIGHTHIQYPKLPVGSETTDVSGYKIFNPGTHEQTDLHNNTQGVCFVITLDNVDGERKVLVHEYVSGKIRYYDLKLELESDEEDVLKKELLELTKNIEENAVVRIHISGCVSQDEYDERIKIYEEALGRFLSYECVDTELSVRITIERIRSEFSELSFSAMFMEKFMDNPVQMQMAYELLKECKDD